MPSPARRLAHRILVQLDRGRGTLADRLAEPDAEALPPRERAFLHQIVLGTLRHRGAVDHALRGVLDRPLHEVRPPAVLAALRLGAYQLLRLRVPPHAAVSEAVDLAREALPKAAGFVNAGLRRLSRQGPPPVPPPEVDPLGWLTTEGSLPPWLAERWIARLGTATAVARARALLSPAPMVFRLNPRVGGALAQVEAAGLAPTPLPVPGCWEAAAGRTAELSARGVLYLQDQGSQMIAHFAAQPGLILDACAAPGGKSTLLGDLLQGESRVVAAEASPKRLRTLASLVHRWGSRNVRVVGADARHPPFRVAFDSVLVDAPCSGLGTLARHPDVRWRAGPEDLPRHSHRQREILDAVAPLARGGAVLVYATCSTEPEENEEVVEAFLESHPDFAPAPLPDWAAPFADGPYARTVPEAHAGESFFAARLRRG